MEIIKKYKNVIVIIMFIVLSVFMSGCIKRYSYSVEELQEGLIEVELVEFGKINGVEIPRTEQRQMGMESHEVYDLIRTLNEAENELFIKELAAIEFSKILCEPKFFSGEGVILTYTNKKIYICSHTLYEEYDGGTFKGFDYPGSPEFRALIEKYLDN